MSRELAAASAAQTRMDKAAEGRRLLQAIEAVNLIHHNEFEPAQRGVAPPPPAPDRARLLSFYRARAKAEVSIFSPVARRAALAEAARLAEQSVRQQEADLEEQRTNWQRRLNADWTALNTNDPVTVMAHLADAFADNEAAAAPLGVEGHEVSVVVLIPPMSTIPDRRPTVTQAGNLSLKKLTKTETVAIYKSLACGHVLVTVKEAFAIAPAASSITAVAVRPRPADADGKISPEVLIAGRFERSSMDGVLWTESGSVQIFNELASSKLFHERGATKELFPVDLRVEPQLAALAAAVDFDDLLGG